MSNKKWRRKPKIKKGELRGRDYFRSESEQRGHILRRAILGEEAATRREIELGRIVDEGPKEQANA